MRPRWCLAQQFVPFWCIVGKYHNLFIHSPIDGHLDHFQVEILMNKATANIL